MTSVVKSTNAHDAVFNSEISLPYTMADVRARQGRNGFRVFSAFCGGGGSSMGYKLAGFDVLGGVDIDKDMIKLYRANLNPKISLQCSVADMAKMELPKELYGLDVLDGSPPCSSFSFSGSRDKAWGKKKKFREGQEVQVLDSLFVAYLELVRILRPRIMVAENVTGMVQGKAKGYALEVLRLLEGIGYIAQMFILDASRMGVPQKRERLFFVATRKDCNMPRMHLSFKEKPISLGDAVRGLPNGRLIDASATRFWWKKTRIGEAFKSVHPKGSFWNNRRLSFDKPAPTITGQVATKFFLPHEPRHLSDRQIMRVQSFPEDYDFMGRSAGYVCGMSVPPLMTQRLALQIYRQLLHGG